MPGMGAAHRCYMRVVARRCQPVRNRCPDRAAAAFAATLVIIARLAGDQQNRAMACRDAEFQCTIKTAMSG